MCNKWLAVEEDDGMIDRLLPVAATEDLTSFQTLFATKTKKSITDSHLWISVFSRPHRSNFTRVQRVSCILSLIMTTMVANAMFFKAGGYETDQESLRLGPFIFSLKEIYISFVSSLIVFPVNIIIDQIFRKTKTKQNKIENTFIKTTQPMAILSQIRLKPRKYSKTNQLSDVTDFDFQEGLPNETEKPPKAPDEYEDIGSHKSQESQESLIQKHIKKKKASIAATTPYSNSDLKRKKTKPKLTLPHWWLYVGWALVILSTIVSGFITFLYSMEWGKEKSLAWLSSMLLAITESVIVIQPFKVRILYF